MTNESEIFTHKSVNISPHSAGRDEMGHGGDLNILKIKCPTPGSSFMVKLVSLWDAEC